MFHISYEAGILEDPNTCPPADMWKLTRSLEEASPEGPETIRIQFDKGCPIRLERPKTEEVLSDPLQLFLMLNQLGRLHGIGRIDIVENRFIGIKSRGCYETPGGTILVKAHMDLEGLVMDREVRKLRDDWSRRLADVIYNGMWFSPERELLSSTIEQTQQRVCGEVTLQLYKGNVVVRGRSSPMALYDPEMSSMDVEGGFNPSDSDGFIRIHAIRLKAHYSQEKGKPTR